MSHYGIYLLQVSLCITVFYLLYISLFRKFTFFSINRYYLLTGLILSFLIPLAKVSFLTTEIKTLTYSLEETFESWNTELSPKSKPVTVNHAVDYVAILTIVYFTGMAGLVVRPLSSIVRLVKLKNCSQVTFIQNLKVIITDVPQPFSFFRLIFMPAGENSSLILAHERIHIEQNHWIDLILIEIASLILWFNPFVYLFKREIKLQHEHLADSNAIQAVPTEDYLRCLLSTVQKGNSFAPVSHLYTSSIKKRILMMTKTRTPLKSLTMYLLVAPFIALLLFAFSGRPDETPTTIPPTDDHTSIPTISPVSLKSASISSGYGKRIHPYYGKMSFHTGIDLIAPEGEPVVAPADGVVSRTGYDSLNGNFLFIAHDEVFSTKYSHLRNITVAQGTKIKMRETIGYVGSTGISTAPHLHYEVMKYGEPIDPAPYLPKK